MQEKRAHVKRLREDVSRCDIQFMDHVRRHMATKQSLDDPTAMELFEAAQEARNLAGPKELEYEPLELALGAEEDKLRIIYAKIETRFEQFFRLKADPSSQQSVPTNILYEESSTESAASGIEGELFVEPRDIAPLRGAWIGGQVAVGQRPSLVDSNSGHVGRPRSHEAPRIIRYLSSSEDRSKRQHSTTTNEDRGRSENRLWNDLFGIATSQEPGQYAYPVTDIEGDDMSRSLAGVAAHSIFNLHINPRIIAEELPSDPMLEESEPLLLLSPILTIDSSLEDYLESFKATHDTLQSFLTEFDNTRDRVNRWLLYHLRSSRRECYALQREIWTHNPPETTHWSILALEEWPNDSLGHGQSYTYGSIAGGTGSSLSAAHHIIKPHRQEDDSAG